MHKRNTVVRRPESSNLTNHTSSEQTNETQKWWVNGGAHSFCSLQPSHAQLHMHTSEPGDAHVLHHSSHWMRINACVCGCGEQKKTMQLQRACETCQQTSANPLPTMQPQCLRLVQREGGVKCLSSAVFCFSRFFTCRTRAPSKKISVKSAGTMWWLSHLHSFFQRYFHFQISICKMRWKDRALSMQMDPSSTHWDLIIC